MASTSDAMTGWRISGAKGIGGRQFFSTSGVMASRPVSRHVSIGVVGMKVDMGCNMFPPDCAFLLSRVIHFGSCIPMTTHGVLYSFLSVNVFIPNYCTFR
jgi:hypothetical protein